MFEHGGLDSHMEASMKPLSEQLADLSVRVKNTEDAAAAAQKEAHDKVVHALRRRKLLPS